MYETISTKRSEYQRTAGAIFPERRQFGSIPADSCATELLCCNSVSTVNQNLSYFTEYINSPICTTVGWWSSYRTTFSALRHQYRSFIRRGLVLHPYYWCGGWCWIWMQRRTGLLLVGSAIRSFVFDITPLNEWKWPVSLGLSCRNRLYPC